MDDVSRHGRKQGAASPDGGLPDGPPASVKKPPHRKRRSGKPCPICNKPSALEHRPFCSRRCADLDLHRWLGGHYRVPTQEPAIADENGQDWDE